MFEFRTVGAIKKFWSKRKEILRYLRIEGRKWRNFNARCELEIMMRTRVAKVLSA